MHLLLHLESIVSDSRSSDGSGQGGCHPQTYLFKDPTRTSPF